MKSDPFNIMNHVQISGSYSQIFVIISNNIKLSSYSLTPEIGQSDILAHCAF